MAAHNFMSAVYSFIYAANCDLTVEGHHMFNFFKRRAKANLEDIVNAMAYANKAGDYYYHRPTQEIVLKVNPVFSGFTPMGMSVETGELVADIKANPKDYIHVPVLGLNENYQIMKGFTETLPGGEVRAHLTEILGSAYPFRTFGRAVSSLGLSTEFEEYRLDAIRDYAVEWCRENDLKTR